MYDELVQNLNGAPLLVAAIACHIAGARSRTVSKLAAKQTPLLAFGLLALLIAIGIGERNVSMGEFLRVELVHLVLFGFVIFGLVSVVLRIWVPVYNATIVEPNRRQEAAQNQRKLEKERKRQDKLRKKREIERNRQWEADRPERERREKEMRAKKKAEEAQLAKDAERREQARTKTLLVFHRHAGDIAESFSWERFCEYTDKYMNDSLPAHRVEENAEQLLEMISSFYESEPAAEPKKSRSEIHAQFERERQDILRCNYSEEETEALLAKIAFRERQAILEQT